MIFSFMIALVVNMYLLIYIGCAGSSSLKDHQISARLDMDDFYFFLPGIFTILFGVAFPPRVFVMCSFLSA
jgi:hypothetical protein